MAPHALKRMTAEEFYRWPGEEGVRYELVDGLPAVLPKVNRRHDHLVVNTLCSLATKLRGTPFRPHTSKIAIRTVGDNIRRPDALVDSGPRLDTAYEATLPRLVIEVVSPSTRQTDFVRKLEEYKALPSLAYILLVEPDLPRALLWWRAPGDVWELAQFDGLEGVIDLSSIGAALTMAEIYEDVTFPDPLAGEGGLR